MSKQLLLTATLAVVCAAALVFAQSCEPDCLSAAGGDEVADPKNCSQYYVALGNGYCTEIPIACPPENPQFVEGTGCGPEDPATCTPCTPGTCHTTCNGTGDMIADPIDCNKYYFCPAGGGTPIGTYCPAEAPYFDSANGNCVNDESVCCDPTALCSPYCDAGEYQIQDPSDCTCFYVCVEVGPADPNNAGCCPAGEYLNPASQRCELGTCTNMCGATTSGVITTTPAVAVTTTTPPAATTTPPAATTTPPAATTTPPAATTTPPAPTTTPPAPTTTPPAPTTTPPAPTTTPPAPTTTPVGPTSDCNTMSTCPGDGLYAMCNSCQQQYYDCTNGLPILKECSDGYAFNPVDEYPFCVLESNCPYYG